jgi:hypothetical protein
MIEVLGITLSVILGGAATICSSMVLFNLRLMTRRIEKVETAQGVMTSQLTACKQDCDRNTVSKEDWVRSEGFTRQALGRVSDQLSRMDGKLSVVEKLPDICGAIARQVGEQIKDARS